MSKLRGTCQSQKKKMPSLFYKKKILQKEDRSLEPTPAVEKIYKTSPLRLKRLKSEPKKMNFHLKTVISVSSPRQSFSSVFSAA